MKIFERILSVIGLIAIGFVAANADVIITNPVTPIPYPYNPSGAMQSQLSITTGATVGLTVPSGTLYFVVCLRSGAASSINYSVDNLTTPTTGATGNGKQLNAGQCVGYAGVVVANNFKAIAATATTAIDVEYQK